jgi:hypothetical protein
MHGVDLPGTLAAFGSPTTTATATVLQQSPGQRLARIAAGLGLFWGLALVGLFIPVAHFILVPTFVVAGIAMAVVRAREDKRLLKVRGVCPRCGAEQEFKVNGRFTSQRSLDCPACQTSLTLTCEAPASTEG